jgi:L-threonylcarbamoyladenylate synthase
MNTWHLSRAVAVLRAGGVVLHATEGVWGLACDPFNRGAVLRILALKQRDVSKGLIVVGCHTMQFTAELESLESAARNRVEASWPGPVTWVLPTVRFPAWITGGRATVAMRVSGHPQVRALCAKFSGPMVSTSANPGGREPARNQIKARAYFHRRVDYVLPGEVQIPGDPSSIVSATGLVLRGTG